MARVIDESGLEKKRKKELIQAQKKQVAEKRTKSQQRTQKKTARVIKLSQAELKWNEEDIPDLRGQKLLDQFAAFKLMGAPFPKKSADVKNVAQKRAAIIAVIACKKKQQENGFLILYWMMGQLLSMNRTRKERKIRWKKRRMRRMRMREMSKMNKQDLAISAIK